MGWSEFGEYNVGRLGARHGSVARFTVQCEFGEVDTAALAIELESLGLAHPEFSGTLHLAATTIEKQKEEIGLLSEKIMLVKGALSRFVRDLGKGAARAETGLDKEEAAALQVLQGIAATLLDDLQDGDLEDDEREDDERAVAGVGDVNDVDMMAPPPPAAAPALPAPRGAPTPPALVRGGAPAALSTAAPRRRSAKHPYVQGAAVLESLVEASRLQSQGKMAVAAAVRAAIPAGTEPN